MIKKILMHLNLWMRQNHDPPGEKKVLCDRVEEPEFEYGVKEYEEEVLELPNYE